LENIHLIAVGGSIMHNLALALHRRGAHMTGSDDAGFPKRFTRAFRP
jgi:UDP-N-acetylmuramate: L-alanyl-gamma-D-glutamyl-meso-diaminopimelate ligase